MRHPLPHRLLCVSAAVAASLIVAACGGGNGNPPPQGSTTTNPTGAPEVTVTRSAADTVATGPVTFTFSFNRDVGTSFTADDITVTGGTKGTFTRVSGTSATLEVVPTPDTAGTITVSIAANAVSDATGNANAAVSATQAYNTVVQTVLMNFSESPAPTLTGFGGAEDATIVNDPAGGTNKVARIVKSATAELWAGTTVSLCPNQSIATLPFATGRTTLTAKVWSPAAGVPVRMKVENAANGAQSVETEATTTVANAWETLSFNFANPATGTAALNLANTYNKASVFFNFGTTGAATGARTYFLDDLAFRGSNFSAGCPPTTPAAPTTAITMDEATAPVLTGFGGAEDATIVNDPAGGTNKVARVVKSATAELWAGTTVSNLPSQAVARIGFTATSQTITVRVYSPTANTPVRLKVENAGDPGQSVETEARTTVANAWETLTFNFATPAAGTAALNLANTYNKVSIFFNFGTTGAAAGGARTYFFEDIRYPSVSTGGGGATTSTINFESATAPTLTGFGGAEDAAVVVDPTNAANKVMRVIKSGTAELWGGTTVSTGANNTIPRIGFSATATTITARVWSPAAGIAVRMKVEDATDPAKSVETDASVTTASGWQTLSFNFANQAAGTAALNLAHTYNRLSVFFDFGRTGAQAGGARTYYLDDIVIPSATTTGGGTPATPVTFASGYRQGGTTGQGGTWGYFSGDFANYGNTFTGGGFADSSPAVADDAQYFFIAVTTTAPTARAGTPANSGGFLGMYVTHPGLTLAGHTTLKVNLGMDANFFRQATNKAIDVFVVGAQTFSNGAGGNCNVTLKGTVTPTTDAMITYSLTLANMTLVQACTGGGFNSGVSTVAQALAQPIGAVNTQFTFPNVNTTINSGTAGAPVYATGLTRGKTTFE
ncbi:MAG: hypothetical protein LW854_09645 [Rubrivivax sp.]|jgi:hypothetical protein|nr:hypothetical protein [Rubrivivax sp.]